MWKIVSGMSLSLSLCMIVVADDTPRKPSVSVQVCGRVRHGVVAIGGETTGTTITCNRMVWELQLHNDAEQKFAKEHDKEPVIVTGTLRKVTGTEVKARWIVDVKTLSERDARTDREGTRLTIRGTLRAADSRTGDSPRLMIVANGQTWPIDVAADATLQVRAEALVGQLVLLTGSLEQVTKEDSCHPGIIHAKTLIRSANEPVQGRSD
ncbi:MAG: hypothetical protein ABGZ35_14405 [Planctomycetaceae bacterium]